MKIVEAKICDLPGIGSYSLANQIQSEVQCSMTIATPLLPYTFYPSTEAEFNQVTALLDICNWKYSTKEYSA